MHVSGLGSRGNIITHASSSSTGAYRDGVGLAPAGGERIDATLGQLNRVEPARRQRGIRQPSVSDDQTDPLPFCLDGR